MTEASKHLCLKALNVDFDKGGATMLRDQVTNALFQAPPGMDKIQTASRVQGADQSHLTKVRHTDAAV